MQQDKSQDAAQKQSPQRMNLTKEEMVALQTCSRESFYYRCVPLGILFMGGTSILVNKGIIKGHPRFGALPKNMFAGLVAYIAGKVSYQGECRKKIMALENSPLAEAMRRGRRGRDLITDMSTVALGGGFPAVDTEPELSSPKLSDSYNESNTQGEGLDDSKRPTLDGAPAALSQSAPDAHKFTSYEELRQQNRMTYEQKQNAPQHEQHEQLEQPAARASPPSRSSQSDYQKPVRRNKYGDIIED